jgi:hypothetical protein
MSRLIFSELGTTPSDTDSGASQIYVKDDGSLYLKRGSSAEGIIGSNWTVTGNDIYYNTGNVGIGTTTPDQLFHVKGASNQIRIEDSTDNQKWDISADAGDFDIYDATNNKLPFAIDANTPTGTFVIKSTGNVGIGTTAPEGLLHIKHATNSTELSANHIFGISTGGISISAVPIAKAWVNFNGTSTLAIRSSYNVASVTDNGTGDYTVNFATAMSNDDYVACGENARSSNISTDMNTQHLMHTYSTGAVSIKTGYPAGVNTLEDSPHTTVVVFAS